VFDWMLCIDAAVVSRTCVFLCDVMGDGTCLTPMTRRAEEASGCMGTGRDLLMRRM